MFSLSTVRDISKTDIPDRNPPKISLLRNTLVLLTINRYINTMTHNQKTAPKAGSMEDRVLDLNGYATALLAAGDYHSAQNALTEALRVLKSVLACSGGGHCQSSSTGPRIACAFATQISAITACPLLPEGSCMVKDRRNRKKQ